jgi:hypothetical protein
MASWGDVETYEAMIADLHMFINSVNESCTGMTMAAQQCADELDHDVASLKAVKGLLNSVQKYQGAMELASDLIAKLEAEKEALIEIIRRNEQMDDE